MTVPCSTDNRYKGTSKLARTQSFRGCGRIRPLGLFPDNIAPSVIWNGAQLTISVHGTCTWYLHMEAVYLPGKYLGRTVFFNSQRPSNHQLDQIPCQHLQVLIRPPPLNINQSTNQFSDPAFPRSNFNSQSRNTVEALCWSSVFREGRTRRR